MTTHKNSNNKSDWFSHWMTAVKRDPKKQAIVGGTIFALAAIIVIAFLVIGQKEGNTDFSSPLFGSRESEPSEMRRRVDGITVETVEEVDPALSCVMIENAAFGGVRPQSGLQSASLVYEVIVEGGITRYMAVFADDSPQDVGPVRSARDTYLEFASEINCAYTHAGGSYTAMLALQELELRDIDALRESQFFSRHTDKFAPHNLFATGTSLRESLAAHGWDTEEQQAFAMWKFSDALSDTEESIALLEDAPMVEILYGGAYDAKFQYSQKRKAYERYSGGEIQVDANTNEGIAVKNVVVQFIEDGSEIEGKGRINWPVTGEGTVEVFRDGKRTVGTWKKADRLSRTEYFDVNGNPIEMIAGNTWIEIVPPHITVNREITTVEEVEPELEEVDEILE